MLAQVCPWGCLLSLPKCSVPIFIWTIFPSVQFLPNQGRMPLQEQTTRVRILLATPISHHITHDTRGTCRQADLDRYADVFIMSYIRMSLLKKKNIYFRFVIPWVDFFSNI